MNRPGDALLGLAIVITMLGFAAFGSESCNRGKVQQAEAAANVSHGAADAHQQQAQASDAQVEDLKAKVQSQNAKVGRLLAERTALLARLDHADHVPVDPVPPGEPVRDDRDAVIAKDAEVIAAQGKQITDQAVVISALTVSRDAWKATAEERAREAAGLRIALDAQKSVANSGKWVGRFQGFAIGIGAGYVAGRLR